MSKSTDTGAAWRSASHGIEHTRIRAIAIDQQTPTTVYVSAARDGLFRSIDGLQAVYAGDAAAAIAVDLPAPPTVYVGGESSLAETTDGGRTWRRAEAGLRVRDVQTIAIDRRHRQTLYAGSRIDDGVFKSTNGGRSWRPTIADISRPRSISTIAIDPRHTLGQYELETELKNAARNSYACSGDRETRARPG